MKKLVIAVSSFVLGLPMSAYAQSTVVTHSGQASVTQADVTAILKSLSPEVRVRLAGDPAKLDQLVRSRLAVTAVLAEASAKGWDKQPQVQAMIEEARRDVVMRSYLASISTPSPDYPSDTEVQAAYDQNKAALTVPRTLRLAQIYIATAPNADAATLDLARKRAADLAHQARESGADFAALAKANSQDKPSAANGGDMGFMADTALVPEIRKAVDGMKAGEVAGPIQTTAGFHVIKLVDTHPAGVRALADVKEQIRAELKQQRAQQNAQAYMAKLAGPGAATIDEAALSKAVDAAQ
ncbi:peptidylprolyl isomerase [Paraburkholderia sp.]|uniref:peptidylprolyl isomerase n=1 Tax=Paraburkholderia sp. TaxID=1926495 RepID=UPI0026347DB1|nr:peptidylprolyl isomerase [Paraburkholderia sp.]